MKTKLLFPITLLPLLLSCSKSYSFKEFVFNNLVEDEFVEKVNEGYKLVGNFNPIKTRDKQFNSFDEVFQSPYGLNKEVAHINLHGTGEQKLLVIPIDFEEHPSSNLPKNAIELIENAFFGQDSANQYYSVSSFYAKSSLDRLHIKGKVAPEWFRSSKYTYSALAEVTSPVSQNAHLKDLYNEAISWYQEKYDDIDDFKFKDISGKDRIPVYFIYSAPYSGYKDTKSSHSSMFWAFTCNSPTPISWSSFFMLHESEGKIDSHTLIHETGHIFGLKDYYDTTSYGSSSLVAALGRADMMDCSLGDHNSFTKMLLDWCRPYELNGDCSITLHSFQGNNEFILVPSNNYNGSVFDEYLLLEFYTPTLLNYTDSTKRNDDAMKLFSTCGVKIYHVDARLALFPGSFTTYTSMLTENSTVGISRVDVAFNNDLSKRGSKIDTSNCLIQLLSAETNTSDLLPYFVASDENKDMKVEDGNIAMRRSLFKAGEGINENMFTDFRWHKDGTELGYNITVSTLTSSFATITFSKK